MGVVLRKRGNLTEMVLSPMFVVIIVLALVFLPLLKYTTSVGQSSYFEREFYTKDLGLMVSALQAAPNNVVLNYENVKKVNVTFTSNYIEAYGYNVNPSQSPSKVSRFHIFPSSVEVLSIMLSPGISTDDKGNSNPLAYNILLNKDSKTITASSSNGFSSNVQKKDVIDKAIDNFISGLYEQKKIYIDVVYGSGKTSDGVDGDLFGKRICTGATVASNFLKIDRCNLENRAKIDERIKLANSADFVVVLFVNEKSNDDLKVYYYEGSSASVDISKRIAEYAVKVFSDNEYSMERADISTLDNDEIKKIITKDKPGIVIQIGNVDELDTDDIDVFSNDLKNLLTGVSK